MEPARLQARPPLLVMPLESFPRRVFGARSGLGKGVASQKVRTECKALVEIDLARWLTRDLDREGGAGSEQISGDQRCRRDQHARQEQQQNLPARVSLSRTLSRSLYRRLRLDRSTARCRCPCGHRVHLVPSGITEGNHGFAPLSTPLYLTRLPQLAGTVPAASPASLPTCRPAHSLHRPPLPPLTKHGLSAST